jgi:hypothetical protein
MKNFGVIFWYVIILFIGETALQIFIYSLVIKYSGIGSTYDSLQKIMSDSLYVAGAVKLVFFLPVYLLAYLLSRHILLRISYIRLSVYHSVLFFLIFLILSIILPGNIVSDYINTISLTVASFCISFLVNYFWRKSFLKSKTESGHDF